MQTIQTQGDKLAARVLADAKRDPKALSLARLLGIRYEVALDGRYESRKAILARITEALEIERERGRTKSTRYDMTRHNLLADALVDEYARINILQDAMIASLAREIEQLEGCALAA
jgi:hypothetical protein